MSCRAISASGEQYIMRETPCIPQLMDRSVAYEMINDFGVDAFLKVVEQYQENMARNLVLLGENIDQHRGREQLWALQYIRNCSAQMGLSSVSLHCRQAIDGLLEHSEPDQGLSSEEHRQFEKVIDDSVCLLKTLCVKMHKQR